MVASHRLSSDIHPGEFMLPTNVIARLQAELGKERERSSILKKHMEARNEKNLWREQCNGLSEKCMTLNIENLSLKSQLANQERSAAVSRCVVSPPQAIPELPRSEQHSEHCEPRENCDSRDECDYIKMRQKTGREDPGEGCGQGYERRTAQQKKQEQTEHTETSEWLCRGVQKS